MSRIRRTTSLCGSIARCAKFVSMGALVSLLTLPVAHAQKGGNGPLANNGGNGGDSQSNNAGPNQNGGQTKGEAGADRALRLLTLVPVPVSPLNTTAGAMYSFDISFVDQATQTYYLADRSNKAVDVIDASTGLPGLCHGAGPRLARRQPGPMTALVQTASWRRFPGCS